MDTPTRILEMLRARGALSGAQIASVLGVSRQAAHRHLLRLMDQGRVNRTGRTRGVKYRLPGGRGEHPTPPAAPFRKSYRFEGLMEDAVLAQVARRLSLRSSLSAAAYRIFTYAFTEMLNNAIEHSHSPTRS